MMTEDEQESSGGVVYCSAQFADQLDEFKELFDHKQKMAEAERFAMAIGIAKNCRMPKEEWKEGKKKRKGTQNLNTFEDGGKYNFQTLFEMLELWDENEGTKLAVVISEYITGGMRWLTENEMIDGSKFTVLKEELPHLFTTAE
jgi:hypothetical protein